MEPAPPLSADEISGALATAALGRQLHVHRELPSTNETAMALALAGVAHGAAVVADRQTAGRGRQGRTWFSPPGANLYCSVLVRTPSLQSLALADWLSWVPLAAAIAATEAAQAVASASLSLKWPNDLLLNGRKTGGFLCESGGLGSAESFVVVGMGLNVNADRTSFPPDLQPIVASLIESTGRPIDRNRLLARWLLELERRLVPLATQGPDQLRGAYVARCASLGRRVRVLLGEDRELVGVAQGIGRDGALQILPAHDPARPAAARLVEIRAADVIHVRE